MSEIASQYQKIVGKQIEPNTLYQKLLKAEELGLMERKIVNRDDEPILTWRTKLPKIKAMVSSQSGY